MNLIHKIKNYPKIGLVLLAYIAFIALGMPDGLLGVGWPSMRAGFGIPIDALGMLLGTSVVGYMTSSFLSGQLIARLGVGRILAISCAMTGSVLIAFTLVPHWWMMVALGLLMGLGAGAIDAGLNTYVAAHFSEGVMQWLHASYGIGITFGPIIMTLGLAATDSWRLGYRIVGAVQLVLALTFFLTLPMWKQNDAPAGSEQPKRLTDYKTPMSETLRQPLVWLSILLFFLYVGGEVTLGTWSYSLLTESRGVDPTAAGFVTGSYWATFTIGRMVAGLFAKRLGNHRLVLGGLAGALVGSLLLVWNPTPFSNLLAVAIVGFANAPIFASLISGTSQRVGEHFAANTIGMQMTATGFASAVIPSMMGVLARRTSLEVIPVLLAVLYAALLGAYFLASSRKPLPAAVDVKQA